MVGIDTLKELERALISKFPDVNNSQQVYLSYLSPVPGELIKSSVKNIGHVFVLTVTGSPAENSLVTLNSYSDVIELDFVFSVFANSNRTAYNKLKELFVVFGYGETNYGDLYKRAYRPFLLDNNNSIMIHDCKYYGGSFKPLVEQFEENWYVAHEATVILSVNS